MVNPPKDETVRIRKMLEKFGSVGDANVFYWFQNRRSRSRRRQRQIQASLTAVELQQAPAHGGGGGGGIQFDQINAAGFMPAGSFSFSANTISSSCTLMVGSGSSSSSGMGENACITPHNSHDFYSFSGLQELDHNSIFCHSHANSHLHYQPAGVITVFINGVATELARGPLDIKAMFGADFVLFHSSGVPVQVNEYGFLVQSLQHGESYFLVPRHS
ncbi:WUSCHEL-related homeobox 11-like [Henckelia pumila]